jgi:hypothetical protein
MKTQVKIQVPIDKDVRDKLEQRATDLGFDSIQAYFRFWAKAEVDGRHPNLDFDDWGEPTDEAAARLNKAAEEALQGINVSGPFETAEDFLKDLRA